MQLYYVPWNPKTTIEDDERVREFQILTFNGFTAAKPTKHPLPPRGSLVASHHSTKPPPIRRWIYNNKEWDVEPQKITMQKAFQHFGVQYTARIIAHRISYQIMPL